MPRLFGCFVLGLSIAITTTVAPPALAQSTIEEIVVTATRRSASVQDVPMAISAFTGEQLDSRGIQDVRDLPQVAPSLGVFESNSSTNGGTMRIRGVGTTGNNPGLEAAVGSFIDGVYRPRSGQALSDMVDIQRVEVLRGPQGTLFGKNTTAGALSLVSNRPEFEWGGNLEIGAGNLDSQEARGMITGGLIEDQLAFRLAGNYRKRDGYFDNIDTSDEFANRDRWSLKGQLLFTPTETVEARLIIDYAERDESCCPATFEVLGPTTPIIAALGGDPVAGSNGDDILVGTNFDPFEDVEEGGASLEVNWTPTERITVTSITAFRDFEVNRGQDVDFTNADIYLPGNTFEEFENFSQELRIQGEHGRLDWLVGTYLYTEDIVNDARFLELSQQGPLFFDLLLSAGGLIEPGTIVDNNLLGIGDGLRGQFDQETDGWALFTHNTWRATDRFNVTVGARFTHEEKDGESVINETGGPGQVANNWPCAVLPIPVFCGNAGFDSSTDEDEVTGTVNLSYDLTDDTRLYASYSRGYKAGGINLDPTANRFNAVTNEFEDGSTFDPEFVNAWEIGLKARFLEGLLQVNSAAFYSDFSDFQLNTFNGSFFTIDNVSEVIAKGVETEVNWMPLPGVTLTGGATYTDSRYGDDAGTILNASAPGGITDLSGQRLTHAPFWQATSALLVDRPLPGTPLHYLVNINYAFRGDHNTGSDLDPEKRQGSYGLWNGQIGLTTADGRYEGVLWGRNLGDKRFDMVIFDAVSQAGSFSTVVGQPRTWGLTLKANF